MFHIIAAQNTGFVSCRYSLQDIWATARCWESVSGQLEWAPPAEWALWEWEGLERDDWQDSSQAAGQEQEKFPGNSFSSSNLFPHLSLHRSQNCGTDSKMVLTAIINVPSDAVYANLTKELFS